MIHNLDGTTHLLPYGQTEDEIIFSVSRAQLNMELMTLAEESENVTILFNHKLVSADFDQNKLYLKLSDINSDKELSFSKVIGCDGSASVLRKAIIKKAATKYVKKPLFFYRAFVDSYQ